MASISVLRDPVFADSGHRSADKQQGRVQPLLAITRAHQQGKRCRLLHGFKLVVSAALPEQQLLLAALPLAPAACLLRPALACSWQLPPAGAA